MLEKLQGRKKGRGEGGRRQTEEKGKREVGEKQKGRKRKQSIIRTRQENLAPVPSLTLFLDTFGTYLPFWNGRLFHHHSRIFSLL